MQTGIRISRRAADRLRAGHLWVYRTDLIAAGAQTEAQIGSQIEAGALVTVEDSAGRALGTALYSSSSQIALRLVSSVPDLSREQYLSDLRDRIEQALARRRTVAPLSREPGLETDAQRLIFSEADELPGMIADRYADLVIVQLLMQGTAQGDVRGVLVEALRAQFSPNGEPLTVLERPDARIRELEELALPLEGPLFTNGPDLEGLSSRGVAEGSASASPPVRSADPATTVFTLNGLRFGYHAASGQKTGAFLDQRLNYAAAADWIRRSGHTGHALDVCTYQGGFALHLAQVCARVTGVDQSRAALEVAEGNLTRNRQLTAEVDWIEADAFDLLRALDEANRGADVPAKANAGKPHNAASLPSGLPARFDAVVLDPPAFAKSRRAAEGALRGYKELNLRAIRLLRAGGTLVTCSCSHHVSLQAFTMAVTEAAADAGRRVQLLETRAAAPDHPEVLTLPETRYLKCLICRVD